MTEKAHWVSGRTKIILGISLFCCLALLFSLLYFYFEMRSAILKLRQSVAAEHGVKHVEQGVIPGDDLFTYISDRIAIIIRPHWSSIWTNNHQVILLGKPSVFDVYNLSDDGEYEVSGLVPLKDLSRENMMIYMNSNE